ncbi:hypothetical protein CGLO_07609 [Colletotrichum gloeosporioides Cg-14]|uniref:Uncharacterized protein n=1 Tax=Colletotrichum gloeosporioides (strain Cg-14) TaxID=1237896 RepID=T0KL68_COLGC|nr:hypothetical protein CGLO_07609 [Colletotrichum gloeosporioides Cg-14]
MAIEGDVYACELGPCLLLHDYYRDSKSGLEEWRDNTVVSKDTGGHVK